MSLKEFKLIVAGGRDYGDFNQLSHELNKLAETTYALREVSIVSGTARGADAMGEHFARVNHVHLYRFPADWNQYGKSAGHLRNAEMGRFADGLLAFWDGKSRGTAHMIRFMKDMDKPVHIVRYDTNELFTAGSVGVSDV